MAMTLRLDEDHDRLLEALAAKYGRSKASHASAAACHAVASGRPSTRLASAAAVPRQSAPAAGTRAAGRAGPGAAS